MAQHSAFALGRIVATPAALEALQSAGSPASELLDRHHHGDWGDVGHDDAAANDRALADGSRLFSVYHLAGGTTIWIITEAADRLGQREATTLLLPEEY